MTNFRWQCESGLMLSWLGVDPPARWAAIVSVVVTDIGLSMLGLWAVMTEMARSKGCLL